MAAGLQHLMKKKASRIIRACLHHVLVMFTIFTHVAAGQTARTCAPEECSDIFLK